MGNLNKKISLRDNLMKPIVKPFQRKAEGHSFLSSFSFWIFVDEEAPPTIQELIINGRKSRIYQPFLSGGADFFPAPKLAYNAVPFVPSNEDYNYFKIIPPPPAGYGVLGQGNLKKGQIKDSLRIDILDDEPGAEGLIDDVISRFVSLLRWRTGQWWIGQSTLSKYGVLEFPILQGGRPIRIDNAVHGPYMQITPMYGYEQYLNDDIWQQSLVDLKSGVDVPIFDLLLLDSIYDASHTGNYRKAVLDADAACEHLKEITFKRLWCLANPGKIYDDDRRNNLLRNWNLPRHLDEHFFKHFRRSYKAEHASLWKIIENLWTARNNVAHGGPNEYGNPPIKVDKEIAKAFVGAAQHCVWWMKTL